MIFVPLLHYFKCKNSYSGNEYGLRYRMIPGKRTVPDPDGGEGATKEESILTVDYWPDPWTIEKTDPALRVQKVFPLTDEGREATAAFLQDAFNADPDRRKNCPSSTISPIGRSQYSRKSSSGEFSFGMTLPYLTPASSKRLTISGSSIRPVT